jgi:AcrR family transcriptional regulator
MKKTEKMEKINPKTRLVLEAATAIFLEHGFTAATTDMIQKQAGVSKATVYSRYPNKEALFIAVIESECERLTNNIKAIEFKNDSIHQSLHDIGYEYLTILLSPSGLALYRLIIAESQRFDNVGKAFYKAGPQVILALLTRQIDSAVEQKRIDLNSFSSQEAASIFLSTLKGEAQLQCLTHPQSRPSEIQIEQWVNVAVKYFLKAFSN